MVHSHYLSGTAVSLPLSFSRDLGRLFSPQNHLRCFIRHFLAQRTLSGFIMDTPPFGSGQLASSFWSRTSVCSTVLGQPFPASWPLSRGHALRGIYTPLRGARISMSVADGFGSFSRNTILQESRIGRWSGFCDGARRARTRDDIQGSISAAGGRMPGAAGPSRK